MTDPATAALVDAIEASSGLPIPTSSELAARIEQQLALRGYAVVGRPPVMCLCTGSGWPHVPSSARCTPAREPRRPDRAEPVAITHDVIMAFLDAPGDDQDDITGPLAAAFRAAGVEVAEMDTAPDPEAGDEVVPCALSTHHRGHRWVQLPGHWRTCPGVRAPGPQPPGGAA